MVECGKMHFHFAQVDVFALGSILNECWTRQHPWQGLVQLQATVSYLQLAASNDFSLSTALIMIQM